MPDVILLTPQWSDAIMTDPRPEPLCRVGPDGDGGWSLLLSLPVRTADGGVGRAQLGVPCRPGEPDAVFERGRCVAISRWGLARLGPGVWRVLPSVVHEGLHAFVVLWGAPDPAPWEEAVAPRAEPPPGASGLLVVP
jgi:hypothetical protein